MDLIALRERVHGSPHGLVAASFDASLHPRGHDGRFIKIGGFVKWLSGGDTHSGQVTNISRGPDNQPVISVNDHGSQVNLKPEQLSETAQIKARLKPGGSDTQAPAAPGQGGPNLPGVSGGSGTKDDPFVVSDVNSAAELLGEGKSIQLNQPDEVSTLLDKLKEIVDDARAKGDSAPVYDLCKVSVPGTNLFCVESKNIPRSHMPQLSGVPVPGSAADALPKNDKGEVDLTDQFVKYLADRGITVTDTMVPASHLRASQNQLNGGKVAGMADSLQAGKLPPGAIFTTQDNYVVDGHHRWAANVGVEYKTGQEMQMPVRQINAPILQVLAIADNFAESMGIPKASASGATESSIADEAVHKLAPDTSGNVGFTVRPSARGKGLTEVHHGTVVAVPQGENNPLIIPAEVQADQAKYKDALRKWMESNMEAAKAHPSWHFGAWKDNNSGQVYLDLVEVFDNQQEAVQAGKQRNEIAVWNLDTHSEISTGGTGGSPPLAAAASRTVQNRGDGHVRHPSAASLRSPGPGLRVAGLVFDDTRGPRRLARRDGEGCAPCAVVASLRERVHGSDMSNVEELRARAHPETVTAAGKWRSILHPRGHDGKFIEIGSLVSFSSDGNQHSGRVTAINGAKGKGANDAEITVQDSSGKNFTVHPGDITKGVSVKADLNTPSGDYKAGYLDAQGAVPVVDRPPKHDLPPEPGSESLFNGPNSAYPADPSVFTEAARMKAEQDATSQRMRDSGYTPEQIASVRKNGYIMPGIPTEPGQESTPESRQKALDDASAGESQALVNAQARRAAKPNFEGMTVETPRGPSDGQVVDGGFIRRNSDGTWDAWDSNGVPMGNFTDGFAARAALAPVTKSKPKGQHPRKIGHTEFKDLERLGPRPRSHPHVVSSGVNSMIASAVKPESPYLTADGMSWNGDPVPDNVKAALAGPMTKSADAGVAKALNDLYSTLVLGGGQQVALDTITAQVDALEQVAAADGTDGGDANALQKASKLIRVLFAIPDQADLDKAQERANTKAKSVKKPKTADAEDQAEAPETPGETPDAEDQAEAPEPAAAAPAAAPAAPAATPDAAAATGDPKDALRKRVHGG